MYMFQTDHASGKNPRNLRSKPPWRIALVANLKDEFQHSLDDPPDAGAEFDRLETIQGIAAALEAEGHWVHFCSADHTLPEALLNLRPHIVFNIAEGLSGDGREAQVPALCELLGIPYTASNVVANAISLDKTQTKRIWKEMGLPTAVFFEINRVDDVYDQEYTFPLFVKPAREGTGMGITEDAVVHNIEELAARVTWVLEIYKQPALVESFLSGREFTVGFIGNPGNPECRLHPGLYDTEGYHWFPILEIDTNPTNTPGVYGYEAKSLEIEENGAPDYLCPADISSELKNQLIHLAKKASQALGVYDVSRVDIRLDSEGNPHLLEINTLPGLNPSVSDICIMAAAEGLDYQLLISEILYLAAERYKLPFQILKVLDVNPKPLSMPTEHYVMKNNFVESFVPVTEQDAYSVIIEK